MAFHKMKHGGMVNFSPKTDDIYPGWLQSVSIVPADGKLPLRVAIHVNVVPEKFTAAPDTPPELRALQAKAKQKAEELRGYKELLERIPKGIKMAEGIKAVLKEKDKEAADKRGAIEEIVKDTISSAELWDDMIVFDARPNSKIRSVLNMIELPADIKNAVSSELQEIWARTPG